jgi:hypothetical protein
MKNTNKKMNNATVSEILNGTISTDLNLDKLQSNVEKLVAFYALDMEDVLKMSYRDFRKKCCSMNRKKAEIAEEIEKCTEVANFFGMEVTEVFKLKRKEFLKLYSKMKSQQDVQRKKDFDVVANFLMSGDTEEVKEFVEHLNWQKFSNDNYRYMNIEFIRKFKDYIDFKYFMWEYILTAEFMNEFRDKLSFKFLYNNTEWFRNAFYIKNGIVYEK